MTRQLFLLGSLWIATFTQAQPVSPDTNYLTTHFQMKVTQFRALPDTKNEIIFAGNSITEMGSWSELWKDQHIKNRGISGDITYGLLIRLDEIVSSKPRKVFILMGINDIARNIPDNNILSNYRKMAEYIRKHSPATKIYFQSLLPTNNEFPKFPDHKNKDSHVIFINGELKKMCVELNLVYIDLYSEFIDANGRLEKTLTYDGLHLNGKAYKKWKAIIDKGKYLQ